MTTWPEWFPEDCPPDIAGPAEGQFFRLVDGQVVIEQDFWSARELVARGVRRRQFWPDTEECKAVACSVFSQAEDAEATRSAFGALRKKQIAEGTIDGDGRLLPTPARGNSHHSWWRNVDDSAWKTFKVVSS